MIFAESTLVCVQHRYMEVTKCCSLYIIAEFMILEDIRRQETRLKDFRLIWMCNEIHERTVKLKNRNFSIPISFQHSQLKSVLTFSSDINLDEFFRDFKMRNWNAAIKPFHFIIFAQRRVKWSSGKRASDGKVQTKTSSFTEFISRRISYLRRVSVSYSKSVGHQIWIRVILPWPALCL